MYKIETHLHTLPVSACGRFTPEEMVGFYKENGYSTIFISDHFDPYCFEGLGDGSWSEKIDIMFDSYYRAKKVGEKIGINVLFSPEYTLGCGHYLLYNTTPEFFKAREDFFKMTIEEFRKYTIEKGVTVIQAHPKRDGKSIPTPQFVDGFEVINSNPRHENFDDEMFQMAREYNLLMSAGSDAHRTEDIATSAVVSPYEIKTTEQFLNLLKNGEAKLMKNGEIICFI